MDSRLKAQSTTSLVRLKLRLSPLTEQEKADHWILPAELTLAQYHAFVELLESNPFDELEDGKLLNHTFKFDTVLYRRFADKNDKAKRYEIGSKLLGESEFGMVYESAAVIELLSDLTAYRLKYYPTKLPQAGHPNKCQRVVKTFKDRSGTDGSKIDFSSIYNEANLLKIYLPLHAKIINIQGVTLHSSFTMRKAQGMQIKDMVVPLSYQTSNVNDHPAAALTELTLNQKNKLKLRIMLAFLYELASVHASRICHGDIKPDNAFYDPQTGIATFIDFSFGFLVSNMKDLKSLEKAKIKINCTLNYTSPEQYKVACRMQDREENDVSHSSNEKIDENYLLDEKVDVYSLGAMFICLLVGYLPGKNDIASKWIGIWLKALTEKKVMGSNVVAGFSSEILQPIIDFLRSMTEPERNQRGDLATLINKFEKIYMDYLSFGQNEEIKNKIQEAYQIACDIRQKIEASVDQGAILSFDEITNLIKDGLGRLPDTEQVIEEFIVTLRVKAFYGNPIKKYTKKNILDKLDYHYDLYHRKIDVNRIKQANDYHQQQYNGLKMLIEHAKSLGKPFLVIRLIELFSYLFDYRSKQDSVKRYKERVNSLDDYFILTEKMRKTSSILSKVALHEDEDEYENVAMENMKRLVDLHKKKHSEEILQMGCDAYLLLMENLYTVEKEGNPKVMDAKFLLGKGILNHLTSDDFVENEEEIKEIKKILDKLCNSFNVIDDLYESIGLSATDAEQDIVSWLFNSIRKNFIEDSKEKIQKLMLDSLKLPTLVTPQSSRATSPRQPTALPSESAPAALGQSPGTSRGGFFGSNSQPPLIRTKSNPAMGKQPPPLLKMPSVSSLSRTPF